MKRVFTAILLLFLFVNLQTDTSATQLPAPLTFTHTTQADWMHGERDHLDVRTLDAMGTPYGWDADPRGAMRLRSQPGEWSEHPASPIVLPGESGAWDDAVISEAKVIFDGQTFHMWYAGRWRHPQGLKTPMDIGYATSPDGVQWQKYEANPVLKRGELGSYDENILSAPTVLYDGQTYHMWYSAADFKGNWSINYATSPDGIRWVKAAQNPLLKETHDTRWDAVYLAEPYVLWNGSGFQMWYNGASAQTQTLLGYATSPDGVKWTRLGENHPVLNIAADGAWDDFAVARASVLYDGERYQMWYEGHDGATWRIGYATSSDGISWTRGPTNPIVGLGAEGSWKSKVASEPNVIFDGQLYRLYHSGYDGNYYRVGLVTAPPIYAEQGVFTSTAFVHSTPVRWGTLILTATIPQSTWVQVDIATSDDTENWPAWQPAARIDGGAPTNRHVIDLDVLNTPASRALRYRLTLHTDDPSRSPLIEQVSVREVFADFVLTMPDDVPTLRPGMRATLSVSLSAVHGFASPIQLGVEGLSDALSATWSPGLITPPGTATLNLAADPVLSPGTLPLTITASGGNIVHQAVLNLTVLEPLPTPTPSPMPTPTSTPTPLPPPPSPITPPMPTPEPMPPYPTFQFRVTAPGGILAVGGAILLIVWLGASVLFRPATSEQEPPRRPIWRHPAWAALPALLILAGVGWLWRDTQVKQQAWEAEHDRREALPTPTAVLLPWLNEDDLRAAVQTRIVAPYLRTLTLNYLDQSIPVEVADLGFQSNKEALVTQALAALSSAEGRQAVMDWLNGTPSAQFVLTWSVQDEKIRKVVQNIADQINAPLLEPHLDEATLTFSAGHAGVQLDVEQAVARIRAAIGDLQTSQVELPLTITAPTPLSEKELDLTLTRLVPEWSRPPVPPTVEPITITFDAKRWLVAGNRPEDWTPTRPMTGYQFLPGQMGWTLDITAAKQIILNAQDGGAQNVSFKVLTDVPPQPLTLADIKPALMEIVGHFDGLSGFYVQDLTTGEEIGYHTMVTTSGMSMIKVAIMVTAYRLLPRPFSAELQDAMSQMIAHSINEKSNYVILQIGDGDFQAGLRRINETLAALDLRQTYIRQGYRTPEGPFYEPIDVPQRPAVEVPPEDQINVWPDTAMQTSLADQAALFRAIYQGALGHGPLLAAFPNLTAQDCQAMLDLLKTNPTRTLLGAGLPDTVPMAHKNGFGGGSNTDERMNVGIIWPPDGRPYLAGLYQWDNVDWIHWLRVWPQQIEFSSTLYAYFTMGDPLPAEDKER